MVFFIDFGEDCWNAINSRIDDPIIGEELIHSDAINSTSEPTLIDDIDKNGYKVHDEEEIIETGEINDETQYFVDIDGHLSHEDNETDPNDVFNQSFEGCIIGKKFNDAEDAYNFYNEYGLSKGFGCKAMLQVTLSEQGKWVVDKFEDEHNHPLDNLSQVPRQWSHKVFHRSKECKDLVKLMSQQGIRPSAITKIVNAYKGNLEDKLTRIQCSAIVGEERKFNLGKEYHGIIMHFQEKAKVDKDFYFAIDLNTDGTFKSVFWVDGRSRSAYNQFGDVVVFDVTYKTNTFGLPFAPFIGVNHHGQTILFGAALLENETEVTFTWLFKNFLECMYDCPPISIITDQDMAMGKAIQKVFPNSRHRFCAWHIRKHVIEHLQPLRSRLFDFKDTYNKWVKSQNISDIEAGWEVLKEKYNIDDDTWLGKMYKLRRFWVKAYLKDTFFAGMTTSGRMQYDKAMSSRRMAEEDEDFRTVDSQPTLHSDHPIEVMAANVILEISMRSSKKNGRLVLIVVMKKYAKMTSWSHIVLVT
uniref:protein FAR1-RELATED SEQUENCE 5-like n=1 Tax=Erigeron canadensis TaxID=72917 RepID=UPI001CB99E50|nr:protein FAR1-RELATED SEQUENCE 5-like [Erigeron canadensis]